MKKNILAVCLTISLLTPLFTRGQSPSFIAKTDSLLNYLYMNDRFCGSVLFSIKGEVIYNKNFPANGIISGTAYKIGSITKMFTAVIIYQLIEEKKLLLTDKLNKFYPQVENANLISIQQMLGHQSGIEDLINNDDFSEFRTNEMSKAEVVNLIAGYKSVFKPGKTTKYSNSNYILLGYIIEDITKQSFSIVLKDRITDPLKLGETLLETSDNNIETLKGFTFNGKEWVEANSETNVTISSAAGAMVSNPEDIGKFITALFNEELINKTYLDTMCKLTNSTFGHGIFLTPFGKHIGYGHTGHIDEFRSAASYFSNDSICFVICINGLNYSMNDIALGVFSYYFNEDYKFPEVAKIDLADDVLKKYEGVYRLKLFHLIPITKVLIKSENGVLVTATAKNFEEEKTIAEPIATDIFKNFQYRSTLIFKYKNNGKIKGCVLEQGKSELYCKRLKT